MSSTKLTTLLNTTDYAQRLKSIGKKIGADQNKINKMANEYNKKYEQEIANGTKRQQLLLETGKQKGLTEQEVLKNQGFIPTVYTPFLNWLYFFMEEHGDPTHDIKRKKLDEKLGYETEIHTDYKQSKKFPDMTEYVYGNITIETFQKLKKLKSLSTSDNKNEAFKEVEDLSLDEALKQRVKESISTINKMGLKTVSLIKK